MDYKLLYVLSDSHSDMRLIDKVFSLITEPGFVIHCGDFDSEDALISINGLCANKGFPLFGVAGNCDRFEVSRYLEWKAADLPCSFSYSRYNASLLLEISGLKIGAHHGHLPYDLGDTDILFHGHTHLKKIEKYNKHLTINPGALVKAEVPTFMKINLGKLQSNYLDLNNYEFIEL